MPFFNVDHRFGLLLIHKCASSAIHNAVVKSGLWHSEVNLDQFKELPLRVAFLREPHRRIESCYRMYSVTGSSRHHDLSSFSNFVVDVCRDRKGDPHVDHQSKHCSGHPNKYLCWDFDEMARLLGLESIPPYHSSLRSIRTDWSDEARAAFDETFAEDIKLWGTHAETNKRG
jgi:hypothetical protein